MLPCKEIVRILNAQEEMSWVRRAELKMHLLMCKHCSNYASHLRMMKDGFRKLFAKLAKFNPEDIQRLEEESLRKIRKASGNEK